MIIMISGLFLFEYEVFRYTKLLYCLSYLQLLVTPFGLKWIHYLLKTLVQLTLILDIIKYKVIYTQMFLQVR